jgi:predicted glycoside hydrolase/deacetylase ChbG (UPF0249 family)
MKPTRLIVNADDFARSEGVNRGILKAHKDGLVSTTTAMMNLKNAAKAVHVAHLESPGLGMGVHLNITFGKPVSSPEKIPSILNNDGFFRSYQELMEKSATFELSDIELEWRNQIEKFLATDVPLDHLDSHHHCAVFTPQLFELFLDLAAEYDCGVRNPIPYDLQFLDLNSLYSETIIRFVLEDAEHLIRAKAIPYPDFFLASFFGKSATSEHLTHLLSKLSPAVYEIMCHPGFLDVDLQRTASYTGMREQELEILTSPGIGSLLLENNIQLHTFRTAWSS